MIITKEGAVIATNNEQFERIRHIASLAKKRPQPFYLDLSDNTQAEYVRDLFGGMEETLFPETAAAMKNTAKKAASDLSQVTGIDTVEGWSEDAVVTGFQLSEDQQSIEISATATAADPFIQMSLHISAYTYDHEGKILKALGENRGRFVYPMERTVNDSLKIRKKLANGKNVGVMLTVTKITEDERLKVYVKTFEYGRNAYDTILRDVIVTHPTHQPDSGLKPEDPIVVCFCRTPTKTDKYDYMLGSLNNINFYIPSKGCAEFKTKSMEFDRIDKDNTSLTLIRMEKGGVIPFSFPEQFEEIFQDNSGSLEYLNPGFFWDFGTRRWTEQRPIQWLEQVNATYNMNVTYYIKGSSDSKSFVLSNAGKASYHVNPIHMYWGCLAEGTAIRMADGRLKNIEEIEIGEKVQGLKEIFDVVNVWTGRELQGIYRITTQREEGVEGHTVKATCHHPFISQRGMKMVSELVPCTESDYSKGDSLLTEEGTYEKIIEIFLEAVSEETVYNLELAKQTGELPVPEEAVLFAEGLAAGDNQAQGYALEKYRKEMEERFGIPVIWEKDVHSAERFFDLESAEGICWKKQ